MIAEMRRLIKVRPDGAFLQGDFLAGCVGSQEITSSPSDFRLPVTVAGSGEATSGDKNVDGIYFLHYSCDIKGIHCSARILVQERIPDGEQKLSGERQIRPVSNGEGVFK